MADFNALEALINAYIKQNGVQAITGQVLNGVLRGMVSALGKGWTIAGEADPNTDPGTMTGPVAYIAHTAGTYTNFGGLVVADGEVAFLKYNEQTWTKEILASLVANASVDDQVGTPSVGVSWVNGVLSFDFRNLKGNPGQDGDSAGFGVVNATVDGNIGTPGVSVSSSGPDTAKNFTFNFTNLKGETGVTSVVVTVDNTSGNPACTASLSGQVLTLAFTGLKGAQGDPGSSLDYPFTLVNNLTTNDATQALTAAMGVQLESEISQLELDVEGLRISLSEGEVFYDLASCPSVTGLSIDRDTNTWQTELLNVSSAFFQILSDGQYVLKAEDGIAVYAILNSTEYLEGGTPDFADGFPTRYGPVSLGDSVSLNLTEGTYLWFRNENRVGGAYTPVFSAIESNPVLRESFVDVMGGYEYVASFAYKKTTGYKKLGNIGPVKQGQRIQVRIQAASTISQSGTIYVKANNETVLGQIGISGTVDNTRIFEISVSSSDSNASIGFEYSSGDDTAILFTVQKSTEEKTGDIISSAAQGGDDLVHLATLFYAGQNSARIVSLPLYQGKEYYARFGTSNPGDMTVCTYDGSSNIDYFVETRNSQPFAETRIKCTKDVSSIKFYAFTSTICGFVQIFEVRKEGKQTENNLRLKDIETNYGESSAIINKQFVPMQQIGIVFLDCSYKYFSVAKIKSILDQMYMAGLHYFEFGFWGSGHGISFKLNDMTFIADGVSYDIASAVRTSSGKYLDEDDVDEIIEYAKTKDIEIIPSLDAPGHMDSVLQVYPQFLWNKIDTTLGALNLFGEDAVSFGIGCIEIYAKWFASRGIKHLNIGGDEWDDVDTGYYSLYSKHRFQYADFLNRLSHRLAKYQLVLHCWNDALYIANGDFPLFNRGLVVHYWGYKNHWATVQKIKAKGHDIINSSQAIYWVANGTQITEAGMRSFNVKSFYNSGTVEWTPCGASFCVWIGTRESPALDDDGAAITNAILPLIQAFGETIVSQLTQ